MTQATQATDQLNRRAAHALHANVYQSDLAFAVEDACIASYVDALTVIVKRDVRQLRAWARILDGSWERWRQALAQELRFLAAHKPAEEEADSTFAGFERLCPLD